MKNRIDVGDDLLSVLYSIEDRIKREIRTSSLGVIDSVDQEKKESRVQLIPLFRYSTGEEVVEPVILCKWTKSVDEDLLPGDVVLVVFTDFDFRGNLDNIRQGREGVVSSKSKDLHSTKYGIIVDKIVF